MATFKSSYTDDQREAAAVAFGGGLEGKRVIELAAAGELTDRAGERLEPFEITSASTVRDWHRRHRRRMERARAGAAPALADAPPRDAIEQLRRELITAAHEGLAAIRRYQTAHGGKPHSWEDLRQAIRCVREAASIPGPNDPRATAPGVKVDGRRLPADSQTRGGTAGALLTAHRAGSPERPEPPPEIEPTTPEPTEKPAPPAPTWAEREAARIRAALSEGTASPSEPAPEASRPAGQGEFPYHRAPAEDFEGCPVRPPRR